MSPGPSPRSSQWSALQPWSVNLLLCCLTSPVWVAHVDWPRLWPPLTHCPWWELLARGNSGDAWGSQEGGSPGVREATGAGGWEWDITGILSDAGMSAWSADIKHWVQSSLKAVHPLLSGPWGSLPCCHSTRTLRLCPPCPGQWPVSPPREAPSIFPSIMLSHCSGVIIISVGDRSTHKILLEPTNRTLNNTESDPDKRCGESVPFKCK